MGENGNGVGVFCLVGDIYLNFRRDVKTTLFHQDVEKHKLLENHGAEDTSFTSLTNVLKSIEAF